MAPEVSVVESGKNVQVENEGGFSLIEMIGVLAIISILAALLSPVIVKRLDFAATTREANDLSAISNAIAVQVLQSKTIVTGPNWPAVAANYMSLPANSVSNNARGYARAFLLDGGGWLGRVTLPYVQSRSGSAAAPAGARILIVSSIGASLPVSSGTLASNVFNDIWLTPGGSRPTTWGTWSGKPGDLLIQRITLDPLFHRLILNSNDGTPKYGSFTVDTTDVTNALPVLGITNAWYLEGTIVGLYDTNSGSMTLEGRDILLQDSSYVYENGIWRAQVCDGRLGATTAGGTNGYVLVFDALMNNFLNSGASSSAKNGASPRVLASGFYSFMLDYYQWSLTGFNPLSMPNEVLHSDYSDVHDCMGQIQ
jgi:prepilin-type N-terminal cleavage/methylation domain-containing protein